MINPNTMYRVTGRYMDGQKVIGYHLVGEDGSQSQETRDRVIWLIGKGIISNMRIQVGNDKEVILRGKGINLNNLPVYDPNKDKYRNNGISQAVANSNVSTRNSSVQEASPLGQYKITRRIMMKNKCLGYELQDYSGSVSRKQRDAVIKLATQKLICNAVVQKYTDESGVQKLILRGVGCDLSRLPVLVVNEQGKVVDPTKDISLMTVRGAYMKHSGIVHDSLNNMNIPFKSGDFILCGANGELSIKSNQFVKQSYDTDKESTTAMCDNYLSSLQYYTIEVFGQKPIQLIQSMIKNWAILRPVANAV